MSKHKEEAPSKPDISPKAAAVPADVCSVCGQGGDLSESAGVARWHKACGDARPDVIAKVKARA